MVRSALGVLLLAVAALPAWPRVSDADREGFIAAPAVPSNVGDAKLAALAYHDSGAYSRDLSLVAGKAAAWLAERTKLVHHPALVLDIDETSLSNWQIIRLDDFGRPINGPCNPALDVPCGWAAWDLLGRDPPIQPTLELFQKARSARVTVFFITGRPESQRAATEKNLAAAGYRSYQKLYMVPNGAHFPSAAEFKAPVRATIEKQGFTILANVGDQPSDLRGGHAAKSFLLPNPFYRVP